MNFRAVGGGHACSSITWDCRGELMFAYRIVVKSLTEFGIHAIASGYSILIRQTVQGYFSKPVDHPVRGSSSSSEEAERP